MSSYGSLHEYYVDQMNELGFVSQPFSLLGSEVDDAIFPAFDEVMAMIYESEKEGRFIINAFATVLPGRERDSAGFIDRRRMGQINPFEPMRGPGSDNKDLLHFTPLTISHVFDAYLYPRDEGRRGSEPPKAVCNLLNASEDVYQAGTASLHEAAKALNLEETIFAPKGNEHTNVHVLRIVHYLGRGALAREIEDVDQLNHMLHGQSASLKAGLHLDRSKITATLLENKPGLVGAPIRLPREHDGQLPLTSAQILTAADGALENPIDYRDGSAKVFAGAGLLHTPAAVRLASGDPPQLFHAVLNPNPDEDRHAAVLFANEHAGIKGCGIAEFYECDFDAMLEHAKQFEQNDVDAFSALDQIT